MTEGQERLRIGAAGWGEKISIPKPPKYVGKWKMPGAPTYFMCTTKPRWLTRFMMKHVMQWEWRDE